MTVALNLNGTSNHVRILEVTIPAGENFTIRFIGVISDAKLGYQVGALSNFNNKISLLSKVQPVWAKPDKYTGGLTFSGVSSTFTYITSPKISEIYDYELKREGGVLNLVDTETQNSLILETDLVNNNAFFFDQFFKAGGGSGVLVGNQQLIQITSNSVNAKWDANASDYNAIGVQPTLVDTICGNNALGYGYVEDGSAWVSYGDNTPFTLSASIELPGITAQGNAQITLPAYQSAITVQLPGIQASATVEHTIPAYALSASIELPGIQASAAVEHEIPAYALAASIELPGIIAQGNISFAQLNYSAAATIALPGIQASANVEHEIPAYALAASIELPGIIAQGNISFAQLNYSAAATITLPGIQASATVEYTLPVYTLSASIQLPGITAIIDYEVPPIGFGNFIVFQELSSTIMFQDHNQPLILKG